MIFPTLDLPWRRARTTSLVMAGLLAACANLPPGAPSGPKAATPATGAASPWLGADELLTYASHPTTQSELENEPLYRILAAEFAGQRDQLPFAVEQYGKLAATAQDPNIAERAAKIAVYAHDYHAAALAAERWVATAPTNLEARQLAAAMHIRLGEAEPAIVHLNYVLARDHSGHGDKLKMIANLLGREEDKTTALSVMERLIDKRDSDPDALLVYAVLALRAEQLDKSRAAMDRLVAHADINPNIAIAYVAALQKEKKVPVALDFLERALKRTPREYGLRLLYARMLAAAERYDDARTQFLRLRQQVPDSTDALFALGLLNLQTNRIDEAERNFVDLAKVAERRDDANFYLGQVAESRHQPAAALKHYAEVASGASYFQARVRTAVLLAGEKKLAAAREILAGLRPENDEQRKQLVLIEVDLLAGQKAYTDAMAVFDKALNGNYDTTLLYSRAMLAERMDRLDVLEADLREILHREPENGDALNALGFTLADRTNRFEEAHDLIQRALTLAPDNFYVLDSMGWVLYRLGRLDEAVPYLEKARAQRNDPEVAAHLGEVLWKLGRKDDARKVLNSALKTHPEDEKLLSAIKRFAP